MTCKHCGEQLPEGAKFCSKCGNPTQKNTNNPGNNTPQKKSSPIKIIVTVIIVVLVLLFVLEFSILGIIIGKNKSKDTTNSITTETEQQNDITTSNTDNTQITTEAIMTEARLPDYKSAYLSKIKEYQSKINLYYWQLGVDYSQAYGGVAAQENTPIALTDITGDEIPELIMMYSTEEDNYMAILDIYTCDESGSIMRLYSSGWDYMVAGGTSYCMFKINGSNDLYAYTSISDESIEGRYVHFKLNGNAIEEEDLLTFWEGPNDDYTDTIGKYTANGKEIKKKEYKQEVSKLTDNITEIVMFNTNGTGNDIADSHSSVPQSYMTYGEAVGKLMNTESATGDAMPFNEPIDFVFSSGAGAWSTDITVNPDGTFTGSYHDADAGDNGSGYDATIYVCSFSGKFTNIKKEDDHTFTMELEYCNIDTEHDKEWIEDKVRYVPSEPYGISGGKTFKLYMPGTKVADLPESYVGWVYGLSEKTTLSSWGLYNVEQENGFYSYQ